MFLRLLLATLGLIFLLTLIGRALNAVGLSLGLTSDFVIRLPPGGRIVIRGQIPWSKCGGIREFFGDDLREAGPFVVRGTWKTGAGLQLTWGGRLTPGQRQRARNFLVEHLR
jgi:hypothetical protein